MKYLELVLELGRPLGSRGLEPIAGRDDETHVYTRRGGETGHVVELGAIQPEQDASMCIRVNTTNTVSASLDLCVCLCVGCVCVPLEVSLGVDVVSGDGGRGCGTRLTRSR